MGVLRNSHYSIIINERTVSVLIDNELRKAIEREQELRKVAYNLCKNDVEQLIKNKITDEKRIDAVIDQILNFITDEKFCELHRRLSDYVETFDSELADVYRSGKEIFLCYSYKMDGVKFLKGDIFNPNRTGHECIVCHPVNCKGELCTNLDEQIKNTFPNWLCLFEIKRKRKANKDGWLGEVWFKSDKTNGHDYNLATMFVKEVGEDNKVRINLEAFRKSLKQVCIVATPLPARTLTTVRIPYMMGLKMTCDEWEDVYQIILEELTEKEIPVEIWQE